MVSPIGSKPHSKAVNFSASFFTGEITQLNNTNSKDKIIEQIKKKNTELYSDISQKIFSQVFNIFKIKNLFVQKLL